MNPNENQIQVEVFQPEINSQIKLTTLEELREWIKDGTLQPNHQVRVKNLSWVEARKIPAFRSLFEAKRNNQDDPLNHSYSQTSIIAPEPVKPPAAEEKPFPKSRFFSLKKDGDSSGKGKPDAEITAENETKPAEPSVVFQAFEKKFLTKDKNFTNRKESFEASLEPQKKSPFRNKKFSAIGNEKSFSQNRDAIVKRIVFFVAGCLLAGLLSYGVSYLWVYQLKSPAQIDEKSLPEISGLEAKLTSDKLGLRLKEQERKKELKESGDQENPVQHQDISQQIAQLEKQFDTQRKAVVENQRIRLQEADFNATFSFSLAVLLAGFVLVGVFKGKNPQPDENKKPAKPPVEKNSESAEMHDAAGQKNAGENLPNGDAGRMSEAEEAAADDDDAFAASDAANFQDRAESFAGIIYVSESVSKSANAAENAAGEKKRSPLQCYQHRDKPPKFFCDICENYFCADCTKSVGESGNHCPYCKLTCKSIEIRVGSDAQPQPQSATEITKKPKLLELGKNSEFVVYDYPDERTKKLGIIPAFVIAALFSASISIFWVYKISPYLESRNQEISQNVSSAETANKTTENLSQTTSSGETKAEGEPCVNPAAKETFECDDETRKSLYEQNRKMKAVEDAQKKVAEKSGVISSPENSSPENVAQTAHETGAEESAKKEAEKQRLIKTFAVTFVIIFGLLLSTRFFYKEKNLQPE